MHGTEGGSCLEHAWLKLGRRGAVCKAQGVHDRQRHAAGHQQPARTQHWAPTASGDAGCLVHCQQQGQGMQATHMLCCPLPATRSRYASNTYAVLSIASNKVKVCKQHMLCCPLLATRFMHADDACCVVDCLKQGMPEKICPF